MAVLSPTVLIAKAGLTSYFCHPDGSTVSHCTNSPGPLQSPHLEKNQSMLDIKIDFSTTEWLSKPKYVHSFNSSLIVQHLPEFFLKIKYGKNRQVF
jgi:hypothetical protein